jgi:hypothetical protein
MSPRLLLIAALMIGAACGPEAPEPPAPKAGMPDGAEHPEELLGLWEYEGQSMNLMVGGDLVNIVSVSLPGDAGSAAGSQQGATQEGRWGVSDEKLYLEINGQTIEYDLKHDGDTLTVGKGSIQFDYKRSKKSDEGSGEA